MQREFLLPLAGLSLALTGCHPDAPDGLDSIVGTWGLRSETYKGEVRIWPYVEKDDGDVYTIAWTLTLDSDLRGTFGYVDTTEYANGDPTETESYDYTAAAVDRGDRKFDVSVPDDQLSLACTIDDSGRSMTCPNSDPESGSTELYFER